MAMMHLLSLSPARIIAERSLRRQQVSISSKNRVVSLSPLNVGSNSDEAPAEHVVHITRGYSREHRPDLNQVMLELIVEHQAGIPVLMKPLSGNTSDGKEFGHSVHEHMAQLQTTDGTTYLVADRALDSDDNLQKLAASGIKWITRVPATLREAQAALDRVEPQAIAIANCCRPTAAWSTAGS
jgi:transposase